MKIAALPPLIWTSAFLLAACANANSDPLINAPTNQPGLMLNADMIIPKDQIPGLRDKALKGSGSAAMKLERYYEFVAPKEGNSSYWMTIAAENGDVAGIARLGDILYEAGKNIGNKDWQVRGIYWLQTAAGKGDRGARDSLKYIPKEEQFIPKADK